MTTITYNLNDRATITLTEEGAEVINAHYDRVFAKLPAATQKRKSAPYTAGATFATELWHLMQIFGRHCIAGSPNLFENNAVTIKPVK